MPQIFDLPNVSMAHVERFLRDTKRIGDECETELDLPKGKRFVVMVFEDAADLNKVTFSGKIAGQAA